MAVDERHGRTVSLKVLPYSGKVESLREETKQPGERSTNGAAEDAALTPDAAPAVASEAAVAASGGAAPKSGKAEVGGEAWAGAGGETKPSGDAGAGGEASAIERKLLEGKVIAALQLVYDPEIPVNIYELGLIYSIDVRGDRTVKVTMTLTAPACPVAGTLPGEVEQRIESIDEVKSAEVELVWDPPWSRDRMSEAAMLQLGMF